MKKLFIVTLGTLLFTTAKSQVYIQGGLNLANISTTNSGSADKNNMLATFNAGFLARSNTNGLAAVESGLLVEGRGAKVERGSGSNYYKVTFNPLYLELPVNLVVRIPISTTMNVFINGGAYFAAGIGGKSKLNGQLLGISGSNTEDIKFTNADPNDNDQAYSKLKRFDYGLNIGAGLDLKAVLLKVNYGYGLAKIDSKQTNNDENGQDKYRTQTGQLVSPKLNLNDIL